MGDAIRIEDHGAVRHLVLCRPDEYNTITIAFRNELDAALDRADADNSVRVVLLRAEGPSFCSGFGLDWSTVAQAESDGAKGRVWDSVADVRMIGVFGNTFAKLHSISKPTLAAVQGWCIAGGTDMVLCADMIIAAEGASFGYPPSRVWGTPTTAMWVYRMGLERAKAILNDYVQGAPLGSEAMTFQEIVEEVPVRVVDRAAPLEERPRARLERCRRHGEIRARQRPDLHQRLATERTRPGRFPVRSKTPPEAGLR